MLWQQLKNAFFGWQSRKHGLQSTNLLQQPLADLNWLAIDLELTGLNVKQDEIVSVGWLQGRGMSVCLDTCHHAFISTDCSLNQSPVIHGITHTQLQQAENLAPQLEQLASFAQSHVWVFHCHHLDWGILSRKYRQLKITCPRSLAVDTLMLERYITSKAGGERSPLDLNSCRQRYGFPTAPAHNALDDANATLELLLAQLSLLGVKEKDGLKSLKHTGAVHKL